MEKNKKILAIIGATYVFGAEKVSLDVLKGLKKNGYILHCMVSGWNDGDFIERLKIAKIDYTPIKLGWYYISKVLWSLDSLVHYPKAIYNFIKLKKKFSPDIFYTISFRQIVLLYPLIPNDSVIYNVQDPSSNSKLSKLFLNLINKKIKYFTACSNNIKLDLIKSGISQDKIQVIHNGIEIVELEKPKLNDVFTLGIVGQIIERKGHHTVIEAMKILQKNNIIVHLKIIGKGDIMYIQKLKQLISDYSLDNQVIWSGFIKGYNKIYNGIDLVIAPTQNEEPFGLMTSEANMFGIPVIVSNKGGLLEIIEDGITGYSFNASDANELANKISILYYNREMASDMGSKGRERIIQFFSVEQMNYKLNELLFSL